MADDATQDVTNEISLDQFNEDEAKPQVAPSAAEKEAAAPEVPQTEAQAPETDGEAPETEAPAEETEEKPFPKAEERKAQLSADIRDLVAERKSLREEVERLNAQVYQPATEDELMQEQGLSATDAKLEALNQRMQIKEYNDRVVESQLSLSSDSQRVLREFPIFDPDSDQYEAEIAENAAQLMESNLIIDPNTNQVIGSHVPVYQLYKSIASAHNISATKGKLAGQKATETMMANADVSTAAAPPAKPKDELMELWTTDD